ncbi:MAG TPA: hypothetical protein ENH92_04870 [Ectothiorhodospiraceae bacterium]|nr:hypothetical protein [Ectothiorhodospiraceae bacterium]
MAIIGVASTAHASGLAVAEIERLHTLVQKGGHTQALELIASLPPELQQRLDIRFYRATSLAGIAKNGEAIEAFERLIALQPQYPEFYNNLAMLLVEEGKLLEAQQALELGLRSNKSYAMLYNNLTVVFETMARRSYAKALQIKEEQSPVLTSLVTLESFVPPVAEKPVILIAATNSNSDNGVSPSSAKLPPPQAVIEVENEIIPTLHRQIEARLYRWIDSWQNHDIAGYIDSYSPNFKSRAYRSHETWLKARADRIGKSTKIDIAIEAIKIATLSSNRIQADFMMDYRSDRYSDRSKKRLIFKQIEGRWRIVRELTLAVVGS